MNKPTPSGITCTVKIPPTFKKLYEAAALPLQTPDGYTIQACILSESGKPIKCMIPPRNTKLISTGIAYNPPTDRFNFLYTPDYLNKEAVFIVPGKNIIDTNAKDEIKILLYNGGLQTYYVEHGATIAELVWVPKAKRPE